jgi:asparagine synthase (glutamine-hydrolysing)
MCGIVGLVRPGGLSAGDGKRVRRATEALEHRGPDASGVWIGSVAALGATRLSIRGGESGRQPLTIGRGPDGSAHMVFVFNGEIYDARNTATTTDTQTSSAADSDTAWFARHVGRHGADGLARVDGMFAFAAWEPARRRLLLARDRWGEKPLYWALTSGGGLAFASEPRALQGIDGIDWTVEATRVVPFLRHSYWPGVGTPWRGVRRLGPGRTLEWLDGEVRERIWWAPPATSFATLHRSPPIAEVRESLLAAVSSRLVGDRPIGVLLSGGLDSSLVAALAAKAGRRLPVWTVRWRERGWDEREHASQVSSHLGLKQHWVDFAPEELPAAVDSLVDAYGEPFGDESLLPTSAVIEAASSSVSVVLTGDGGDELFGGYQRYCWNGGDLGRYRDVFSACPRRTLRRLVCAELLGLEDQVDCGGVDRDERDERRWIDLHGYLSDDLLRKVDRAAGRVGVENRAPFLTRDVTTWALTLSARALWLDDEGKQPLRRLAEHFLPLSIVARAKRGFGVPLSPWFRGPLRDWVADRLLSGTLDRTAWFEKGSIETVLREHIAGEERSRVLFNLLVLAIWLEQEGGRGIASDRGGRAPSGGGNIIRRTEQDSGKREGSEPWIGQI